MPAETTRKQYDIVVVGGGISGLSLAYYCAGRGLSTLVLEKAGRPGGAIHSERLEEGFWLEMGTHTCYNSYGGLLGIIEQTGLREGLIGREKAPWMLWEKGGVKSIMGSLHWGELMLSLPRLLSLRKEGLSVAEYFGAILGRRNYRDVAGPMIGAVTCQEAARFPAAMLFKKRPRRKEIMRSFSVEGGLQSIPEAIAASDGVELLTGVVAAGIEPVDGGTVGGNIVGGKFKVTCGNGGEYIAGAVALATPPNVTAKLLGRHFKEIGATLSRVGMAEAHSVGVAVGREECGLPRLAGLVAPDEPFLSVVSRDTLPHPTLRGFVFHFRPGLPEERQNQLIASVLGVPEERWRHRSAKVNVIPAPVAGHEEIIAELERQLEGRRLLVTGNYFGGLAVEDCVARSAAEAARLLAL